MVDPIIVPIIVREELEETVAPAPVYPVTYVDLARGKFRTMSLVTLIHASGIEEDVAEINKAFARGAVNLNGVRMDFPSYLVKTSDHRQLKFHIEYEQIIHIIRLVSVQQQSAGTGDEVVWGDTGAVDLESFLGTYSWSTWCMNCGLIHSTRGTNPVQRRGVFLDPEIPKCPNCDPSFFARATDADLIRKGQNITRSKFFNETQVEEGRQMPYSDPFTGNR